VRLRDDEGSAVVEFTLVGVLLTILTLGVIQLGLALHVRNTVHDAAAEGARFAALADNVPADGVARTRQLITEAIGAEYATDVSVGTVRTTLPVVGLLGVGGGLEVSGHAAVETLD
jgi:Flp pilus assembly protein TadG